MSIPLGFSALKVALPRNCSFAALRWKRKSAVALRFAFSRVKPCWQVKYSQAELLVKRQLVENFAELIELKFLVNAAEPGHSFWAES